MQRKHAEEAVLVRDVVNFEELRHHAGEIFVGEHDAFGFSRCAGSEDQRGDRGWFRLGKFGGAFFFDRFVAEFENIRAWSRSLPRDPLPSVVRESRMLLAEFFAENEAFGFSGAQQVHDFVGRQFFIHRDAWRRLLAGCRSS